MINISCYYKRHAIYILLLKQHVIHITDITCHIFLKIQILLHSRSQLVFSNVSNIVSNNELGQILILNPNPNLAPNPTPNGLIPKSQSEFRKFYQC